MNERKNIHPNSLANLKPIKPGEVRNPTGFHGNRPYSGAIRTRGEERMPEEVREYLNRQYSRRILGPRSKAFRLGQYLELFEEGVTWSGANAVRLHLNAILDGDVRHAIEIREAAEGRATQRIEMSNTNSRLRELIDALRSSAVEEPASSELSEPQIDTSALTQIDE
jgi:hypothetical protein